MSTHPEDYDRLQMATEAEERALLGREAAYSLQRGALVLQLISEGHDLSFSQVMRVLGQDTPEATIQILEEAVGNVERAASAQEGQTRAALETVSYIHEGLGNVSTEGAVSGAENG